MLPGVIGGIVQRGEAEDMTEEVIRGVERESAVRFIEVAIERRKGSAFAEGDSRKARFMLKRERERGRTRVTIGGTQRERRGFREISRVVEILGCDELRGFHEANIVKKARRRTIEVEMLEVGISGEREFSGLV